MDKERHYIMIREPIYQKDITILNIYALNNTASQYMQQKLIALKGENGQIHNYSWILQLSSLSN